jgi:hypothetical protein
MRRYPPRAPDKFPCIVHTPAPLRRITLFAINEGIDEKAFQLIIMSKKCSF